MKKIISFITLFSLSFVLSGLLLSPSLVKEGLGAVGFKVAYAQNIGTLQPVVTPGFSFKKDLMLGDTDPDVKELQRVLNADIDTMVATEDVGSRGKETTYFGELTKTAVIKLQNKYKDVVLTLNSITTADGKVNKATRTRLNLLLGVMNTYDSVGLPQSRASNVVVPSAPVIVAAPTPTISYTQPNLSTCQFVDLLINIGVISSNKANQARGAFSCQSYIEDNNFTRPTVTLKVNGDTGTVNVPVNTNATISWTSRNADECSSEGNYKPTSGSKSIFIDTSGTVTIACTGPGGSVSDTVTILAINTSTSAATTTVGNYDYSYLLPDFGNSSLGGQKVLSLAGEAEDVVSVSSSASLKTTSQMTLEAWVKPTSWISTNGMDNTKGQVIITKGNIGGNTEYALALDNGKLVYSNNDAGIWTCSPVVPLNTWTHVAVSVNESTSTVNLFVNGVKMGGTATSTICEGPRGFFNKSAINKANAITNITATSSVYLGNYYPKANSCSLRTKTSGFIGSLDDVRIWNIPRTEAEIKANMKLSVKNSTGLVAYWTFDNGLASDVTAYVNNGFLKGGAQIITDTAATSSVVVATDYTFGFSYTPPEPCDTPATASTTPPEYTPKNSFGGVVSKVTKCLQKPNLTEVVIDPCGAVKPITAQINKKGPSGEDIPVNTLSGQIKINIRDNMQPIPKVGDMVLGNAVNDKALTCTSLVDGGSISTAEHVGTVTGNLGAKPDTENKCGLSGGGGGGGGSGFGLQTGTTAIGCVAGGPVGCIIGSGVGKVLKKVFNW